MLYSTGYFFCRSFAHTMHWTWLNRWTGHMCRTSLGLRNGVSNAPMEFPPRGQHATIQTWKLPPEMQCQPETQAWGQDIIPFTHLPKQFFISYSSWLKATLFQRPQKPQSAFETLCARVYLKHLALRGYYQASLSFWGFGPMILIKGCSDSFQDADAALSKDTEALGLWAFPPAWRHLTKETGAWHSVDLQLWDLFHHRSQGSFVHDPLPFPPGFFSAFSRSSCVLPSRGGFLDAGIYLGMLIALQRRIQPER